MARRTHTGAALWLVGTLVLGSTAWAQDAEVPQETGDTAEEGVEEGVVKPEVVKPEVVEPEPEPEPEVVVGIGPTVIGARPEVDVDVGKRLFKQGCATCHGIKGDGKGPAARFMYPKPRDLTSGQYRFRSTAFGQAPLPEDVYRTLQHGLTGTPMPGFVGMDPEDLWQVVYYVLSLSDTPEQELRVVPVPDAPPMSEARIARGGEVYTMFGCSGCHGTYGAGDGAAAAALVDSQGNQLYPADLTQSQTFKRGEDPIDLFRTISTGLNGTPMAGFEMIPAEDRWALVYWIMDQ